MIKHLLILAIVALGAAFGASAQTEATDSTQAVELNEVEVTPSSIVNTATGYRVRLAGQNIVTAKSTTEVLKYLPDLSVEQGSIKINGLATSEITVNGRKIYDRSELERLPADMIESVEVKYAPSAKNITSSAGGTLAIKLKPLQKNGYYGTLYGGGGYGRRQGLYKAYIGAPIYAKVGKLNIYESPYLSGMDFNEWSTQRIENLATGAKESTENARDNSRAGSITNTLALNYDISSNHTLGVSWRTRYHKLKSTYTDTDDKSLMMRSPSNTSSNVVSANYTGTLNENGDVLQISADWMNRHADSRQLFFNSASTDLRYKGISNLCEANADYAHQFGENHSLNAGLTYRWTQVVQDKYTLSDVATGPSTIKVTAQTPQPYASMQGSFGRLRYYAVINWQENTLKVGSEKAYSQNAVNPTLQLSMPFGANNRHRIMLSYIHSLGNVPYDAITEEKTWSDPYSYNIGNRDLKAPSDHYLNANLSLWNSGLSLSAAFTRTNNDILWESFNDENNPMVTYTKPMNIAAHNTYTLRAQFMHKFSQAWTISGFGRLTFSPENQMIAGANYDKTRLRQYYSISNSLNFNNWGAGLNYWIEPTYNRYDRTFHTVYQLDLRLYKLFLNKALQVVVDIRPLEQRRRIDRRTSDRLISMRYTTPIESVEVQVAWRFSGGKKDVKVKVKNPSIKYEETRDQR